jgi:putative transposase
MVMRSDKKKARFKPIHKRWLIKRTFLEIDDCRKVYRNYEIQIESPESMVKIATIKLLSKKI